MEKFDVLIIGAGPAGLTAAIYLQRAGYRTLTLESYVYGGQMVNTLEVENYPAVSRISGVALSTNLYNQAIEQGAQLEFDGVTRAVLTNTQKELYTSSGKCYTAQAVVVANGARRRKLGVTGEDTFSGRGVSYCATCDGGFFKGKQVAVIGGGNTAVEDALYLSNIAAEVRLIHRRDQFRAAKVLVDSLHKRENIHLQYNTTVLEIQPDEAGKAVGGLSLRDVNSHETHTVKAQGVFVAIGLEPDNGLFQEQLHLDSTGYIIAGEDTKTNLNGVFAAGDTRTKALRQIVTAAGDGAVAAFEVGNYLAQL